MGEYAIRKSDNERVKIGTCEDMYYLRFEDRFKVRRDGNGIDPVRDAHELRFRLPWPDEDDIEPGSYEGHSRGVRLVRKNDTPDYYDRDRNGVYGSSDFQPQSLLKEPGSMQLRNEAGLLASIKCYHGIKLPEDSNDAHFAWNGKSWFLELSMLRGMRDSDDGEVYLKPVVKCRHCREQWRFDWADIWEYLYPAWQQRFEVYKVRSEAVSV